MKLPTLNGLENYLSIKIINPEIVPFMVTAYRHEMNLFVQEVIKNDAYTNYTIPFNSNGH